MSHLEASKRSLLNISGSMVLFFTSIGLLVMLQTASSAQDVKSYLFSEAQQAFGMAKHARAEILAPKTYNEGLEFYRKAESDYSKGRNLSEIRKSLRSATNRFRNAVEASKLAQMALGSTIQARADAQSAEAQTFASKTWREAEEKFSNATRTLESGNVKEAQKVGTEAEKLFRDAELQAIKANYLSETYQLLKTAEREKVAEYAPKTLTKAQSLVKEAEKEINENRYDTDVARIKARLAKREAQQAIHLANTIKTMRANKQTFEDAFLSFQNQLTRVAVELDFVPSYDQGIKKPVDQIVQNIRQAKQNTARLNNALFDAGHMNTLLEQRIGDLERELTGVETQRAAFARKLEEQARIRQLYDEVEKLFTGEIAIFIRDGNDIIIRTVGLSFPVGKSTIDAKYYEFLGPVTKAIDMFPQATVTVEGHTDSYGSDATNLKLSFDRAEAVKHYLLSNSDLSAERIEAIGYGESAPIATNETEEGRARNRRIEIIIHPKIGEAL